MKTLLLSLLFSTALTLNAQYTKLLDFNGSVNGSYPYGDLYSDGTYLYGMTVNGGVNNLGVIFKILPDGTGYTKLLDFAGPSNGKNPFGSLISVGTFLYGMTKGGGTNDFGTIFRIMPDGTRDSIIYNFGNVPDGSTPYYGSTLFFDGTFLYGMCNGGGANIKGTIFRIKPDGTAYSILLDFSGATNGAYPGGGFISDGIFLYGMTSGGGTNNFGTVFRIKPDGTGDSLLFSFTGPNGNEPINSLVSDGIFLYGMTLWGGTNNSGVIFKIKMDGTSYTKLYDFSFTSGTGPWGSLFFDGTFLYGMTYISGANNLGTLFKIKTDGTGFTKILDFAGSNNGATPYGSLISDGTFLYGLTSWGGTGNFGTIFKFGLLTDESDYFEQSRINVFPNPFSTQTTLELPCFSGNVDLNIYNSLGQVVKQISNISGQTIILHRDKLPSGIYFLRLSQNNKIITTDKLIITD